MGTKLKSLASIFIPLLLGLALTVYFYNSFTPSQMQQMKDYFINADYNYVILSLLLAISGYVLRAYRWKYTLSQIGCEPDFKLNFLAVSIGYFVNLTIPRSGRSFTGFDFEKISGRSFLTELSELSSPNALSIFLYFCFSFLQRFLSNIIRLKLL